MERQFKLSILLLSVPSRVNTFLPNIINELNKQIGNRKDIEVTCLLDNKTRSVGEKRNMLLKEARGDFVTFIDDDDRISPDYISSIMEAIENNPDADCIVFDSYVSINSGPPKLCKYGIEFEYNDGPNLWVGKPAHTMIWRREIALQGTYPEQNFGEDTQWVKQVWPLVKNQVRIDKVLYLYDFNSKTSETRK